MSREDEAGAGWPKTPREFDQAVIRARTRLAELHATPELDLDALRVLVALEVNQLRLMMAEAPEEKRDKIQRLIERYSNVN